MSFRRPWLLHMRQDIGMLGTDSNKAISQKHPNISSRVKRVIEDDSFGDCIQSFLIETGADMKFWTTPD